MELRPPQSVYEIEKLVGDDYINEVQELGNKRDKASLEIARKALQLIEELPQSRSAVYSFYAKHTGTSTETIRKDVRMLELIPTEFWTKYEVIGISFFRHVTHFDEVRMTEALDYALHNRPALDEFTMLYPRLNEEEDVKIATKHQYPFYFVPMVRELRTLGLFDKAKVHLDAINEIMRSAPTERNNA